SAAGRARRASAPRGRATSRSWWRNPTRSARCGRRWPRSDRGAEPSLPADLELRVVARGRRLGLVRVREHGDADGLRRLLYVEEFPVVLEHVHLLLPPLAAAGGAAAQHANLRETGVGDEVRADRDFLAPDVLHGLRSRDARVRHEHVDGQHAVVAARLPLVRALGELARPPRPREHWIGRQVPAVYLARGLDTEPLGGRAQEALAALLLDRVDALAGILAGLPVAGELADLRPTEVVDQLAIVFGGHGRR